MAAKRGKPVTKARTPLLESISAGIGVALFAAIFGFLVFEAVQTEAAAPPMLVVEPTALASASGQHVVEVKISNRSRATAAAVQIEGVLKQSGSEVEKSSATFDYVPGKSEREGGIVFTKNPRDYALEIRVTGYERP